MVFALGQPPVDDADQIPPPWRGRGEPDLAARGVIGLKHDHPMPALAEHPGGLQPGGAGTDDHRLARCARRRRHVMGQPVLAPG